jgi:hypothetical protein
MDDTYATLSSLYSSNIISQRSWSQADVQQFAAVRLPSVTKAHSTG